MTTTTFVGAKGGVGTSTVAVLHALELARTAPVYLSAATAAGIEDLACLLGLPTPGPATDVTVVPGLTLGQQARRPIHTVIDAGTDTFTDHPGEVYLVMRNDYLSIRRAVCSAPAATGIVLVAEPHRALTRRDIEDVLALPIVAEITLSSEVARAIDAGLLAITGRPRIRIVIPTAS